jgi:hypothetical protein
VRFLQHEGQLDEQVAPPAHASSPLCFLPFLLLSFLFVLLLTPDATAVDQLDLADLAAAAMGGIDARPSV